MINYLEQILALRKEYSKEENKLIEKAYRFAEKKHKGQKFDGYPYPYFIHPAYSGLLLTKWKRNYEEICAGLLHDVVEDCNVPLLKIKKKFNKRIAFLVDGMSWEIKWNKETKSWYKDRPGFYKKIMTYSLKDIGLVIVHAADEMSKLSDILKKTLIKKDEQFEKTRKRHVWTASIMVPFYKKIGLKKVSYNILKKIKPYFKKIPKSELHNYISEADLNKIKRALSRELDSITF